MGFHNFLEFSLPPVARIDQGSKWILLQRLSAVFLVSNLHATFAYWIGFGPICQIFLESFSMSFHTSILKKAGVTYANASRI